MTNKYRIHIPYINSSGNRIADGIYSEGEFDMAEARYKSIVTLENSELKAKSVPEPDTIKTFEVKIDDPLAVKDLKLDPTQKIIKVEPLKINSAKFEDINKIKYVGKKQADKVIELRANKKFSNYVELNQLVPLGFNRKWEDLIAIDFEYKVPTLDNNAYSVTPV